MKTLSMHSTALEISEKTGTLHSMASVLSFFTAPSVPITQQNTGFPARLACPDRNSISRFKAKPPVKAWTKIASTPGSSQTALIAVPYARSAPFRSTAGHRSTGLEIGIQSGKTDLIFSFVVRDNSASSIPLLSIKSEETIPAPPV